jgi:ferritin-like metal-binding protein YciE
MKQNIKTLQDALTYQLQGLFYAETQVREEFSRWSRNITSRPVKSELQRYIESIDDKLLKLERIFNYLMQERLIRKNAVVDRLLEETRHMLDYAAPGHLKDILMISCIQNINAYKISSYKTAYLFSIELELDTASDMLQQIIEWELQTSTELNALSIQEFNRLDAALQPT